MRKTAFAKLAKLIKTYLAITFLGFRARTYPVPGALNTTVISPWFSKTPL
jgi:hypothetical protein